MNDQTAPICFVDTETTGLHHGRLPWDVAVIRRDPDGTETAWQTYIDVDLSQADPFGLKVGRFYERHPLGRWLSGRTGELDDDWGSWAVGALSPWVATLRFARITHGAHIVGAVPNFDTEVLGALLREAGFTPAWHYHLVDIENLAVGYLAGKGQPIAPPWKSDELTEALGLPPTPDDEKHTALGDAKWAMRVYDAVMRDSQP